ncbi:hypothetical protein WJX77_012250 [Trebouxia sp. C0004]
MSKRPTDHLEPAAKKRGNDRQLTKDDPSDEDEPEQQGEFAKASEEVMKKRRIVRPKRGGGSLAGSTPAAAALASANPFAGVSLTSAAASPFGGVNLTAASQANPFAQAALQKPVPEADAATRDASKPSESSKPQPASTGGAVAGTANTVDVASSASTPALNTAEANMAQSADKLPDAASAANLEGNKSDAEGIASTAAAPADFSSFLSANKEQSPFAVKAGGETSAFGGGSNALSFGSTRGNNSGGGFGAASQQKDNGGFTFKPAQTSPAGSSQGAEGAASAAASPSTSPAQAGLADEQAPHTGEEGETVLYNAEGTLFQFDDQKTKTWRERGRGELRVNKAPNGQARLVMRQRGNFRLLLNANLWPHMPVSMMDGGKGVTFPCINHVKSDESDGDAANASKEVSKAPKLASFAFRKKAVHKLEELLRIMQQETSADAASTDAASAVH